MKKLTLERVTVFILLAIVLAIGVRWHYQKTCLHQSISLDTVESIALWGERSKAREATKEEQENIVTWFNSAIFREQNTAFAGTTPSAGISIQLKSGKRIDITDTGLEVFRADVTPENVAYWIIQSDLSELLNKLEKAE